MKLFLLLLLTEMVVSTEGTSRTNNYLRGNYHRALKKNKLDNFEWGQFAADLAAMTDVPSTQPSLNPTTATPSAEPTLSPTTATPSSVPSKELTLTPTNHPSDQPTKVRLFLQNNVAYCSFVLQMTTYIIFSHAQIIKRHLRFKNGWNLLVNRHLFQLIPLLLPRKRMISLIQSRPPLLLLLEQRLLPNRLNLTSYSHLVTTSLQRCLCLNFALIL